MTPRHQTLVALAILSLAGCAPPHENGAPAAPSVTRPAGSIRVAIEPSDEPIRWSKLTPLPVKLTNTDDRKLIVVLPGDGSEAGWRTPTIRWTIEHADGTPVEPLGVARCGNTNPLEADEIVDVAPGESIDLGSWIGWPRYPGPGQYRVVFHYENDPAKEFGGLPLGAHDSHAVKRLRASTPCRAASEPVAITVVE